jgi:phosphopantetheinyl transferase
MDLPALEQGHILVWSMPSGFMSFGLPTPTGSANAESAEAQFFAKSILAQYLKIPSQKVKFVRDEFGKPFLDPSFECKIHLNWSHTKNNIALALSVNSAVGVDIEVVDKSLVTPELSQYVLAPAEAEQMQLKSVSESYLYFFDVWTAKEAYLKMLGAGISEELLLGCVLMSEGHLKFIAHDGKRTPVFHLPVGERYRCAVAVHPQPSALTHCHLEKR